MFNAHCCFNNKLFHVLNLFTSVFNISWFSWLAVPCLLVVGTCCTLYLFDWALNIFANLRKASLYKRLRWYFFFYLSALHLAQITPNSISVAEPTVKRKKKTFPTMFMSTTCNLHIASYDVCILNDIAERRQAESARIREKYSDRIPVIYLCCLLFRLCISPICICLI